MHPILCVHSGKYHYLYGGGVTFLKIKNYISVGAIVVVIAWQLDLQLPVQSVPITTNSCEFEPCSWQGVLDTILCDKLCQ